MGNMNTSSLVNKWNPQSGSYHQPALVTRNMRPRPPISTFSKFFVCACARAEKCGGRCLFLEACPNKEKWPEKTRIERTHTREAALKSLEGESRGETFPKVSPLAAGGIKKARPHQRPGLFYYAMSRA
jgi:hypothetical protein